ncbi:MAG: ATP-binding protein [Christensenellaceae bacterium]
MIDQVVSVAGFRIKDKNQHFTVQIDEDVPRVVRADRQRLAQVITNLLSNATKFTDEGGHIELYVRHKETAGEQSVLEIEVKDDGIGISAEQQTRLFQSFEQADGSISRKYGGTGLGLAISKRIIEMMGGREWIISELGEGARFIFTVRVGIGSAEEAEENEVDVDTIEELGDTLKGKHILLAEDVEVNREILLALLEGTGILFDCAENGKQAIEMFKENPGKYDMIFMDIHMPEVDGYEATQRIRAMEVPQAKTIPIVAMTANVFKEDIEKCLAAGMNDHVGKPLEMSEVAEKLQKYLG